MAKIITDALKILDRLLYKDHPERQAGLERARRESDLEDKNYQLNIKLRKIEKEK